MSVTCCVLVLALIAGPLPYLLRFDHEHGLTAVLLGATLGALSFYSQRGTIAATMVLLAGLGDYRRYVGYFEGYTLSDPLLLVAPSVALLLLMQALLRGQSSRPTTLSCLVLALMALMGLEALNPLQGGLQIGFAGAVFYLAPLLWFWVARCFASPESAQAFVFPITVSVGAAAALLGLYQAQFGLMGFEQQWVDQIGYGALYISDEVIRSIGFFNSSAEYQRYLTVAAATVLAGWLAHRSRLILLLPVFLVAIFLSAARGPVVMVLLSMSVVWAIAARRVLTWLPRLAFATVIGALALTAVLGVLQASSWGARLTPLVERQVGGLLDPGNEEKSTATGHLQMIGEGILTGLSNPAGIGLGATTVAAQKYGARNLNAEVDVVNLMISTGVLGGALYVIIVVLVLARAVNWWRRSRRAYSLAIVGSLVGTVGGWLIGGEYSAAALLWFQIGLMDRLSRTDPVVPERTRVHAPRTDHA